MPAPRDPDEILRRRDEISATVNVEDYSALRRLAAREDRRFVVSLGGGTTPGLCGNLALVRLLEELQLKPHVEEVWGTSAGAIVGGAWATDTPAEEILRLARGLNSRGSIDFCLWKIFFSLLLRPFGRSLPDGVMYGRKFAETIRASLKVKNFEDSPIPFRCIAVSDDGLNRRKVFRSGPLSPAIFSSMSLPGIIVPRQQQQDEETNFYDGGLVEKTPIHSPISAHLRSGDERKLLLLATHFGGDSRKVPAQGFIARFIQSIYALEDTLWEYQLAEARRKHKDNVDLLIVNPHIFDESMFDFGLIDAHYLQARENFMQALHNASLALTFGKS